MAKTKPITSPKRLEELKKKRQRINYFAFDNQDREATFRFALRQGLTSDQVAAIITENFTLDGTYLNPKGYVAPEE